MSEGWIATGGTEYTGLFHKYTNHGGKDSGGTGVGIPVNMQRS